MSERTFKVDNPPMRGEDVRDWQATLNRQMRTWGVDYRIKEDGVYHVTTRALTGTVAHGLGLASAMSAMRDGVTPELRTKLRNKRQTPAEKVRYASRAGWRRRLKGRYEGGGVAMPVAKVIADSWGWHPGVHDGIDLICRPDAILHAICSGTIVRADTGGWWGKGAPSDPNVRGKGDGIIILRADRDAGPIRKGMNLCYGHAEHPQVKVGDHVRAGDVIGRAGEAVAWHVHFMVNMNDNDRGVGDRDPRPVYNYVRANA